MLLVYEAYLSQSKVVFLAATKPSDLMDAALRRAGRFDKKYLFLRQKNPKEFSYLRLCLRNTIRSLKFPRKSLKFVQGLGGEYTGAEIESIVIKAIEVAEDNEKMLSPSKTSNMR